MMVIILMIMMTIIMIVVKFYQKVDKYMSHPNKSIHVT